MNNNKEKKNNFEKYFFNLLFKKINNLITIIIY